MKTPSDLFLMRKQFTLGMASVTFITYVAALQQRQPGRFNLSRSSGQIYMSELLRESLRLSHQSPLELKYSSWLFLFRFPASFRTQQDSLPVLHNDDPVDFRMTPNIAHFIGPTGIEGMLTASLVAIGRGLCDPEYDLEDSLSLFCKDESYHFLYVNFLLNR